VECIDRCRAAKDLVELEEGEKEKNQELANVSQANLGVDDDMANLCK